MAGKVREHALAPPIRRERRRGRERSEYRDKEREIFGGMANE
jgi:hypothetical protein